MKTGKMEYAKRKALQCFDEWNEITGYFENFNSYYFEMCAIIEDAVEIGAMAALGVKFKIVDGKPKEIKHNTES